MRVAESVWKASLYAGPKEYRRLSNSANFHKNEHEVMQFSAFFFNRIFLSGYIAPLLLTQQGRSEHQEAVGTAHRFIVAIIGHGKRSPNLAPCVLCG